ncbi:TatD family hydrolase [Aliiglaciecola sp. 3_MG-2023]|uniref:TatD family hydrolase n=1 Tax=Aliiglaciecola sp. 3_MG-2023 TaxID=3062644 RepID=UPI0026E33C14|nr:TatD family hydrolase [Aliiglaciecola sp. 3_MG-2023]MDO6691830.1 TatD family hydrolase [Aliiglaciecola sp. 3_MG-2023]
MIDSHCHLDFEAFDVDRMDILKRCWELGIKRILIPGTQASQWQSLIELCDKTSMLEYGLGIHPYFIKQSEQAHLDNLITLLEQHSSVRAVGEIGLDFFDTDQQSEIKQQDFFSQQLDIANQYKLPVIIHHRRSHNAIIQSLKHQNFQQAGVIHAFSGSYQQAKTYLDLGFKLGFGGVITYPRARKTRDVLKRIPLNAVVLETDAPDMPICGKQGRRNSPEFLPEIAQQIAQIKGVSLDEVINHTTANSCELFSIKD